MKNHARIQLIVYLYVIKTIPIIQSTIPSAFGHMEKTYKLRHYNLWMNLFLLVFIFVSSFHLKAQNYIPGGSATNALELWLDANQGVQIIDNRVAQWQDRSGLGSLSASQTIIDRRPTQVLNALNGQAWLSFNNAVLQTGPLTSLDGQNEYTVFMVAQGNSFNFAGRESFLRVAHNNQAQLWGLDYLFDVSSTFFSFNARTQAGTLVERREINALNIADINPQIISTYWRANAANANRSVDLYVDGVLSSNPANISQADFLPDNHTNIFIGADAQDLSNALNGNIAEVIIFSSNLNDAQRIIIENYLEAKYGGTNAGGITINADRYAQPGANFYTKNLTGIGRAVNDDTQTQGCSGGLCVRSNTGANDFLKDQNDFLLFAYEAATNTLIDTDLPANARNRWERDWFLDKTEIVADGGTLELRFDFDSVGVPTLTDNAYVLLFRQNLSESFQAIAYSEQVENTNEIVFDLDANILEDGYYTIGSYLRRPGSGNQLVYSAINGNGVRISSSPALNLTGDFSIEAWVKIGNLGGDGNTIISKGNFSGFFADDFSLKQFFIQVDNQRRIRFIIGDGFSGTSLDLTSGGSKRISNTGRLNHVAVTVSGTAARIYIDGIEVASGTISGARANNNNDIILGGQLNVSDNIVTQIGELDEVRIWNAALTENTIREWLCRRISNAHPNFANLQAHYDFDEFNEREQENAITVGSNQILDKVLDKAGNNTGILENFSYSDISGWTSSSAPLGDITAISYDDSGAGITALALSNPGLDTDVLEVDITSGSPESIHIYYIGSAPNFSSGPDSILFDESRHWGVHLTGGDDYTYEATYLYAGNSIINPEGDLRFLYRDSNADSTWEEAAGLITFTLDTDNEFMRLSGLSGTEFIVGEKEQPLPIDLLSFEAQIFEETSVLLRWQTATEINNSHFVIERSADGQIYEAIGELAGAGNSTQIQNYRWIDSQPLFGQNLYRLKQVDFDGSFSYSQVRAVVFDEGSLPLKVYPNPVQEVLTLDFQVKTQERPLIQLIDIQGNTLYQERLEVVESKLYLSLPNLSSGIYILRIINQGRPQVFQILKK